MCESVLDVLHNASRTPAKNVKEAESLVVRHAITVNVIAHAHTQHLGKTLVEAYPVLNPAIRGYATFKTTVDNVNSHAETGRTSLVSIVRVGHPTASHDGVTRRLGGLGSHPEPQGGLEGDRTIRLD